MLYISSILIHVFLLTLLYHLSPLCLAWRRLRRLVLMFNLLQITYREGLILVAVMLPTGMTYYFTMVPPVLIYIIRLLVFVVGSIVPWDDDRPLLASHLIVLDKCPGVL